MISTYASVHLRCHQCARARPLQPVGSAKNLTAYALKKDTHLNIGWLKSALFREAYRAALILIEEGAISRPGFNGPYTENGRQVGFVNYGISHIMRLVGTGELAQRASWYQKWNVHLFARPEVRFHSVAHSGQTHISVME